MTPVPDQVRRRGFDEARRQFLGALSEMLADRSIPEADKIAEAWATISSVSQLVVLADIKESV